jgi:DNA recombination protein RmuC
MILIERFIRFVFGYNGEMEMIAVGIGLTVALLGGVAYLAYVIRQSQVKPTEDKSLLLLQEQLHKLTERMDERLDKSNSQMHAAITRQFSESAKIIQDVTQRLTKLDETNKQVINVTDELKTLQNVLQNPKQRGNIGEFYLDTLLGNVLAPGQYQLQYEFKNGEKVDAVIFLDKKILPVDSKFSLENYNRLIEEREENRRDALVRLFKQDLKHRIDETSKYIRPAENTMDFAFMFIPSEAIYNDLLINKIGAVKTSAQDLIEYAYREKKVIIVSPTTFLAYLQTVLQGLRSLQIEEQAKEIQVRVGQLGRHIAAFDTYMQKLGNSLNATVNHYNTAHKELKKVDKDVVKIAGTAEAVEPMLVDAPQKQEELV